MSKTAFNIHKSCYAMASVDGLSAEITMYGDIVEQVPVDWWTGEPMEGQFITEKEFLEDLEQVKGCRKVTLRIHSFGGDAAVSNLIHNRLRELSAGGTKLTCIVDGVAMSGGSLIMCACDTVKVNPSSLIMIHRCMSFLFGAYNADELQKEIETNNAYDKMQASIYQRKTGLPEEEILRMMAETTYMTGKEALEKGFADALTEDSEPITIAASADRRMIYVNGRKCAMGTGVLAPATIPTVTPDTAGSVTNTTTKGGSNMATTIDELRKEYPELTAQLESDAKTAASNDAVQAEQQRLREIDAVSALFDEKLVQEAKYGEKACTAQELSYRAAMAAANQGRDFLKAMADDAKQSNSASVQSAPPAPDAKEDSVSSMIAKGRADAAAFNKMKEGK